MSYFIKKEEINAEEESRLEQERNSNKPVYDSERKLYFVNGAKYKRAKEIYEFITGKRVPNKSEDLQRREHYEKQLAKYNVPLMIENEENPEIIPAIYEIMGGLIRNEEEQAKAEKKSQELKNKKVMIEQPK